MIISVHSGSAIGSFLMQATSLKKCPMLYYFNKFSLWNSISHSCPFKALTRIFMSLAGMRRLWSLWQRYINMKCGNSVELMGKGSVNLPAACCLLAHVWQWPAGWKTHTQIERERKSAGKRGTTVKAAQLTVLLHKFCGWLLTIRIRLGDRLGLG